MAVSLEWEDLITDFPEKKRPRRLSVESPAPEPRKEVAPAAATPTVRVAGVLTEALESAKNSEKEAPAAKVIPAMAEVSEKAATKAAAVVTPTVTSVIARAALAAEACRTSAEKNQRTEVSLPKAGTSQVQAGKVPPVSREASSKKTSSPPPLTKVLSLPSRSAGGNKEERKKEEERAKRNRDALQSILKATRNAEGMTQVVKERLFDIRKKEDEIRVDASLTMEMVRELKERAEGREAQLLQRVADLEGLLAAKDEQFHRQLSDEQGKLRISEERVASLVCKSMDLAGKIDCARDELHRVVIDNNLAHAAHVRDLQKRLRDLEDEKEALRKDRSKLRAEATAAKEAELVSRQASMDAIRESEFLRAEINSLRVMVGDSSGWRERRMADLEEAVGRAVNVIGASHVGHQVRSQAAFDVLLQTLVDIGLLDQDSIRGPAVLPFCGPGGPERFFCAGSFGAEGVPGPQIGHPEGDPNVPTSTSARWEGMR